MKILLVSFDKSLIANLKETLKDYEVIDVKNGEEALNLATLADFVIYDAISGAISEEDINSMYQKKFKDAKFIILIDEIFPVNMDNILPKKKVGIKRDEAVNQILKALSGEPMEEEKTSTVEYSSIQEVSIETPQSEITLEYPFMQEQEESILEFPSVQEIEIPQYRAEPESFQSHKKKVLVVSFDSNLTESIKEVLSPDYEVVSVKHPKDSVEKIKDADLVIFDTISGMIAQKTLMEISKREDISHKPFIILLDELFTIDVDSIPLPNKYSFSREAQLGRAIEKAREILAQQTAEVSPSGVMNLLDEIMKSKAFETQPFTEELPITPSFEEKQSLPQMEEIPITQELAEILPSQVEELPTQPSYEAEKTALPKEAIPPIEINRGAIEEVLREELSKVLPSVVKSIVAEEIQKLLSPSLLGESLTRALKEVPFESYVEKVVKEEMERVLSSIDLVAILREEISKAVRERLRELIT